MADFTKPFMSLGISIMIKKPIKQRPGKEQNKWEIFTLVMNYIYNSNMFIIFFTLQEFFRLWIPWVKRSGCPSYLHISELALFSSWSPGKYVLQRSNFFVGKKVILPLPWMLCRNVLFWCCKRYFKQTFSHGAIQLIRDTFWPFSDPLVWHFSIFYGRLLDLNALKY